MSMASMASIGQLGSFAAVNGSQGVSNSITGGIGFNLGAASVFSSALGAIGGAFSQYQASKYNKKLLEQNQKIAALQAQDALDRGLRDEGKYRQQIKGLIGQQRVSYAAQGVDVNNGSPVDVYADTAHTGELDALTIRHNAAMEAWGYQVQGAGYGAQANMQKSSGIQQSLSTIATGALDTWVTGRSVKLW